MLPKSIVQQIELLINRTIVRAESVSGGDISEAYLITTNQEQFFIKFSTDSGATKMYEAERKGLELLATSKAINIPAVIAKGDTDDGAFLMMEYIPNKRGGTVAMQCLGEQLAQMHQTTAAAYGADFDNFIGSLPQQNTPADTWIDFYINRRLMPQFRMAINLGLLTNAEIPSETDLQKRLESSLQVSQPALLHGDLWGGNYLIHQTGSPYLIDPAVYFGDKWVDIAMSQLFGGFSNRFYEAYYDQNPAPYQLNERLDWYQLYYLLVHLNIFGNPYLASVRAILDKYR